MPQSADINATAQDPVRLESGDHLDQPAFHRLYEATPEDFRAELIEGVVILPPRLTAHHGHILATVNGLFCHYRLATAGVRSLARVTVLLPPDSEPEPDCSLIIEHECGGQTRVEDRYLVGPPELVIVVATSGVSCDVHSKYRMYEKVGVREYVVAVLKERDVRWFASRKGRFVPLAVDDDGIFRSRTFPGLWLDAAALWEDDTVKLFDALNRGRASFGHAEFVAHLRSQRGCTS